MRNFRKQQRTYLDKEDLNAKVGSINVGKEQVMGKQGCGIINDNGNRLVNFWEENNLVIGGTMFNHKGIYKLTWTSPIERYQTRLTMYW
jgi:hypothetical protein